VGAPERQTFKRPVSELVGISYARVRQVNKRLSNCRLQFRVRFPREIWIVGDENLPNVS
jgi:hypothetical protein